MTLFSLVGRIAVVTGGGRGLGAAMAEVLAGAGASVALLGRDGSRLREQADLLTARHDRPMLAIVADVADSAALAAAAATVATTFGRLDILLNNAGIASASSLLDTTEGEWAAVLDTNLSGVWRTVRAFAPAMIAGGEGRIINIGSVLSSRAAANRGAYAASKAGLVNLTRALAIELGPQGVTANLICPSVVVTDLNRERIFGAESGAYARLLERVPAGRWGVTDDLAGALLLFASDASAYISGQSLTIDGGLTAG